MTALSIEQQARDRLLAQALPFVIRLRYPFRGTTERSGLLIPGPSGWGEFAPFDDYSDEAAARWLNAALEASFGTWPTPVREAVPVNAIIPALPVDQARALAREAISNHGCTTIKVKVIADLGEDEARVAAVREELDAHIPDGRIRLDVNGAWLTDQALHDGPRLARYGLEYIEQPTRDLTGLNALRDQVAIAVDEGIRHTATTPKNLSSVADIAIVKATPLGGVHRVLEIAEQLDLPVVVSGSLDSSIGLNAGIHAAACLPDLAGACGLGTGLLLAEDLVARTTVPTGGMIPVERAAPDLKLLAKHRPHDSTIQRLQVRLASAWWAGPAKAWAEPILRGTAG